MCVCDRCLCTLGKCRNVMVVDWGPHDVPMALYRMWVVCALSLKRAQTHCLSDVASCRVDVRCHPDVRGLIEALCSPCCGEIRVWVRCPRTSDQLWVWNTEFSICYIYICVAVRKKRAIEGQFDVAFVWRYYTRPRLNTKLAERRLLSS